MSAKQSYDKLSQENIKLKEYVVKAQQENQLRQQQLLARNKNYKKVVLEEDSKKESDTESEQEYDIAEDAIKAQQVKKPRKKDKPITFSTT